MSWSLFWRATKRRYVVKYKAVDGGWAQKLCPPEFTKSMKRAAKEWAASWFAESHARAIEPARRTQGHTMREAYKLWIALREQDDAIAPATLKGYRSDFKVYVLDDAKHPVPARIADRLVPDVGTDFARLKMWFLSVRAQVGYSRARSVFYSMRVFFDEAIVQKWLRGANPFANRALIGLLPPQPTKREAPPIVIPIEHAQALILGRHGDISNAVPPVWRVRYMLAFTSGDRDGEMAGLTWSTLDIDGKIPVMEVDRAMRLVKRKGEKLGPLKTRTSARTMPLHPGAVAALRWWRDAPEGVAFYLGREPLAGDPVFPSGRNGYRGAFARPRSADKIREHLTALKLPTTGAKGRNITMHATRRTFISVLDEAKVPEDHRKTLAGHGISDVTKRHYTAAAEARLRELGEAVAVVPLRWEDPTDDADVVPDVVPSEETEAPDIPVEAAGGGAFEAGELGDPLVPAMVPDVVTMDTKAPHDSGVSLRNDGRRRRDSNSRYVAVRRFSKPLP